MGLNRGGVVAAILIAGLGVGALIGSRLEMVPAGPGVVGIAHDDPNPAGAFIVVHVAGWVMRPGVVQAPEGALVADVIVLAGGARPGAHLDSLNLARPVLNGDRVEVPGPGAQDFDAGIDVGGLLSLNRASQSDLEGLPGVGPVLAERIISYREANGPFAAVEDLLDVSGIGEAKLASIRDLVTVP